MKQDERSIVRKRTRQLVYLELGRDNGGIMLNLSEDGCAFEAISPVTLGKTRFAFQISGGRRVAGDAEVRWTDEPGMMAGLKFLDLHTEVRKQIRMWLNNTRAPQEPVEVETRQNSWPESSERVMEGPEIPPPWAHMATAGAPTLTLEDVWARFPLLRGGLPNGASYAGFAGLSRRIARMAMVVVAGALLYVYQPEAANTLISLGETIAGRPKVSAVVPESKSAEPVEPQLKVNGTPDKAEGDAGPSTKPEVPPSEDPAPAEPNVPTGNAERTAPVPEQQAVRHDVGAINPSAWVPDIQGADPPRSEGESVASLWEGVQGGSVSAELSLAERFIRGDGVAKNCDQARVLLRAAVNKGTREARLKLYQLESTGCR